MSEKDKTIVCYNCGKECKVHKCSCGAEDWQCECSYGSGHLCNIPKCKKERYCIKNGKLYDRDVYIGYISEYQDETYVDMLNYLDEQLAEKGDFITTLGFKNEDKFREYVLNCLLNEEDKVNRIRELEQQLSEKDKQIESLKNQLEKEVNDNLDWEGKCLCLYSMLYETLEKLDPAPNDIASAIQQMTNENFDKQNEQFKSIRSCEELVKQLVEKDKEIERLKGAN